MDNKKIDKQIKEEFEKYAKEPVLKWHILVRLKILFFKKYFKQIILTVIILTQFIFLFLLILKIKNCLPKICFYDLLIFFLKGEFFSIIATFLFILTLYIYSFWYEDFFK